MFFCLFVITSLFYLFILENISFESKEARENTQGM